MSNQTAKHVYKNSSEISVNADNSIVIQQESDFNFSGNEYRDLFRQSFATAFQSPVWLDELYKQLAPNRGATKIVITGRDSANGSLKFVLPLITRKLKGITLLESADLVVCDYSAPVVHQDYLDQLALTDDLKSQIKKKSVNLISSD